MDLVAAALLGIVQGITEFLPISSSGHLILARAFFGWDPGRFGLAFDVACHVGTLVAVAVYYRQDVAAMLRVTPRALSGAAGTTEHLLRLIIIGTIPVVMVGLLFMDAIEGPLRSPAVVAATLAIGGVGLFVAERFGTKDRGAETIGYGESLALGLAQASALVPGVSRSGATLTIALLLGLRREAAARFAFLLSLPAVTAAALKEARELAEVGMDAIPVTLFGVGFLVSAVVGYLTIAFFIKYLAHHSLNVFAVYRLALAAVTVVWLLTR